MAKTPPVASIRFTMKQQGELCTLEKTAGVWRYGPKESQYHLLVEKFDRKDQYGDAVMQWQFPGIPRKFALNFPEGTSPVGVYHAVVIHNYTGNDASHVSNRVVVGTPPTEPN